MTKPRRQPAAGLAILIAGAVLLSVAAGCSAGASDTPEVAPPTVTQNDGDADVDHEGEVTTVNPADEAPDQPATSPDSPDSSRETATFGAGCFWCVEAVLEQLDGVSAVRSGYMGGEVVDPSYRAVCSGETGHAEVVQLDFDPAKISYETLLDWFFRLHDPTTLNRQGGDVGTQYRSAIFYHSDAQRAVAEKVKSDVGASGAFADPIVTEITAAAPFYVADDSHQDYYRLNSSTGYCRAVIRPKLEKLGLETGD